MSRAAIIVLALATSTNAVMPAFAASNGPAETSLDKCQNTIRTEALKYVQNTQKAIATCLGKVSTEVVKKNASGIAGAVAACTAQFSKIGRADGKSLADVFAEKVAARCDPAPVNAHTLDDLLGIGAPSVAEALNVSTSVSQLCSHFGGDGTIDSASEWISCMRGAQDCAVFSAVATEFPRAIEWLNELAAAIPPSNARDAVIAVEAAIDGASDDGFPDLQCASTCGDGVKIATEQCDGADLGGESCTSLGFLAGALSCTAGCAYDTSACDTTLCGNGTIDAPEQCDGADLGGATCTSLGYTNGGTLGCTAGCGYDASACESQAFPATGQTTASTADKNDGIGGTVAVPDDGTVEAGAPLAYVDNSDGTVTDLNTGLMWEKKDDAGGPHDKDNFYRWSGDGTQETIWDWLDDLNTEGGTGFAGYSDWRIPNKKELESIVSTGTAAPAVSPAFNTACVASCTVLTCSCTLSGSSGYWSSSTSANVASLAWVVGFNDGIVNPENKTFINRVRAVRGGL